MALLAQPSGVLSKNWEAILLSLLVWDLPWVLTGPPVGSRRSAPLPPQLPQPLACLAQECKGGRETEGRGSSSGSCVIPRSGGSPSLLGTPLPRASQGLGLCPSLCHPPWGEPLSFSQSSPAVFALAYPFNHCLFPSPPPPHPRHLNKLLEYSDIFEIQQLEAPGLSFLTHPCPTLPHPTRLHPLF